LNIFVFSFSFFIFIFSSAQRLICFSLDYGHSIAQGLSHYYSAPIINLAGKEYVCSCCGASFDEPWEECPECGVKMKKIKYDPVYVDEAEMLDILLEDE